MFSKLKARKWLIAALVPAVFGVYYEFALPQHATVQAAQPGSASEHDDFISAGAIA